ncbi:thermonuclease family protein [Ruficoccus sp. ZRK36]|uniref:thermonuclease family protein n=1 Tax=Ruficoccus sp. ZRK36 TaxID=2866311 RepID=UPI001C730D87|nr:thermonuclease family protein [Ruficoccus sp. ZRK36]QYY35283.1 thermonuclease family protein [Ruficoccus sp. ZRK36]
MLPFTVWGWPAKAVRVIDGDTLLVQRLEVDEPEPAVRVRLAGIDAPELKNDGGEAAKEALEKLVKGRVLEVHPIEYGKYGRLIADLTFPDKKGKPVHIPAVLVKTGHAVLVDW